MPVEDFTTNCEYSGGLDDIDAVIEEAKEVREELVDTGITTPTTALAIWVCRVLRHTLIAR